MRELFVDTSAWMAVADAADVNRTAAVAFQSQIPSDDRLVVTNQVMKERGINEAFAFDHHFEQMGFQRLLRLT